VRLESRPPAFAASSFRVLPRPDRSTLEITIEAPWRYRQWVSFFFRLRPLSVAPILSAATRALFPRARTNSALRRD